jgi:putative hydrolase of the HAD superfamily
LLTNGWDRHARADASRLFQFDHAYFSARHDRAIDDFDCGRMGLEDYLNRTLFYRPRDFTKDAFRQFMYSQSRSFPDVLSIAAALASDSDYLMIALNNESLPLNEYRIERFELRRYFRCFFSSCFLGIRKPDPRIYELALRLTQWPAERCVFVDDRPENLEPALRLKMRTVRFVNAEQLRVDLAAQLDRRL